MLANYIDQTDNESKWCTQNIYSVHLFDTIVIIVTYILLCNILYIYVTLTYLQLYFHLVNLANNPLLRSPAKLVVYNNVDYNFNSIINVQQFTQLQLCSIFKLKLY